MIEFTKIDGRNAVVCYVDDDFRPVDKDDATLVKVRFETGDVMFMTPARISVNGVPQEPTTAYTIVGDQITMTNFGPLLDRRARSRCLRVRGSDDDEV
jgi:hypothetical protein